MKNILSTCSLLLAFGLTVAGCSLFESQETGEETGSAMVSDNSEYDNMLAQVSAEYKALDKAGGAWAYSDELIEKAAEAAKSKDFAKAMKLLKEANDEISLAKAQLDQQKNAKPYLF